MKNITRIIEEGIGIKKARKRRRFCFWDFLIDEQNPMTENIKKKNSPALLPVPKLVNVSSSIRKIASENGIGMVNVWVMDICRLKEESHGINRIKVKISDAENLTSFLLNNISLGLIGLAKKESMTRKTKKRRI